MPDEAATNQRPVGLPERYKLQGCLGQGQFASVFKAHDAVTGATLAIKVLHPEHLGSVEKSGRFEREMTVCHQLRHPNIIRVESAMCSRHVAYIVMEYLDAQNLAALLRERQPTVAEGLRMVAQVASAVEYIHAAGLVHRDIKPDNIMVGADLRTILTDFSLVRLPQRSSFSGVGEALGSPLYVAPEVVLGADAEARSDIYALGCVMYEVLTGRQAYQVKGLGQLLKAIVEASVPAPSTVNPAVPRALDTVVARCLAKAPAARHASATAFLDDLAASCPEGRDAVQRARRAAPPPPPVAAPARAAADGALRRPAAAAWLVLLAVVVLILLLR